MVVCSKLYTNRSQNLSASRMLPASPRGRNCDKKSARDFNSHGPRICKIPFRRLQRLDLDLPELDHALVAFDAVGVLEAEAVLQGDPARGELGIGGAVDGFLAVEGHGEGRALGGD